jgi:hypothetical protein
VDKVLHLGWSPIYLRLETTTRKGGVVCKALACASGSLAGSFMRTALVLRFSWMILGVSLAHRLARRALARTLRRQRLSRVHVGRPSGDGSGARVSGRLLHKNPKIGLISFFTKSLPNGCPPVPRALSRPADPWSSKSSPYSRQPHSRHQNRAKNSRQPHRRGVGPGCHSILRRRSLSLVACGPWTAFSDTRPRSTPTGARPTLQPTSTSRRSPLVCRLSTPAPPGEWAARGLVGAMGPPA